MKLNVDKIKKHPVEFYILPGINFLKTNLDIL